MRDAFSIAIVMFMCILMYMNIYISKENEAYIRSLKGSMSGYINFLITVDKEDAKSVRDHVVKEGIALGKLKPRPMTPDGHQGYDNALPAKVQYTNAPSDIEATLDDAVIVPPEDVA